MRSPTAPRDRARRVSAAASILALGLTMAACSSPSTGASAGGSAASAGGTVHVLAEDINYTDNWKTLLPQFEKETGITVKIDTVPYSDMASKILLGFTQKSSDYDVVFNDNTYGVGYHQSKYVEDLNQYAQADTTYGSFDKLYQPYLAPMTDNGTTFERRAGRGSAIRCRWNPSQRELAMGGPLGVSRSRAVAFAARRSRSMVGFVLAKCGPVELNPQPCAAGSVPILTIASGLRSNIPVRGSFADTASNSQEGRN